MNVHQLVLTIHNVKNMVDSVAASEGSWEGHVTNVNLGSITLLEMAARVSNIMDCVDFSNLAKISN